MVLRSLIPVARYRDDPFDFLRSVQRSLDDVWAGTSTRTPMEAAALSVRVDVKEDEQAYHLTADLPGLSEKDVEVTFDDGVLTIRGEKKLERDEKKDTWHITERTQGSFARQLSLPANIDTGKIEAKFEKGVLSVLLPKAPAEQASVKKIPIKAA